LHRTVIRIVAGAPASSEPLRHVFAEPVVGFGPLRDRTPQIEVGHDELIDAGVDEFIVPDFNLGRTIPERTEAYDRFREDVAKGFR